MIVEQHNGFVIINIWEGSRAQPESLSFPLLWQTRETLAEQLKACGHEKRQWKALKLEVGGPRPQTWLSGSDFLDHAIHWIFPSHFSFFWLEFIFGVFYCCILDDLLIPFPNSW